MTDERSKRLRERRQRRHQRLADLEETTSGWECGIVFCKYVGETVMDLITHQTQDHPPHTCKVCHQDVPDGFIAIYHVFEEHSRAEYVREYDASSDEVRQREQIKTVIERQIDVPSLIEELTQENRTQKP